MSVKAVAAVLGLVRSLTYDDATHLDGVRAFGVGEHTWRHVRGASQESNSVTTLVDLTPRHRRHRASPTAGRTRGLLSQSAHAVVAGTHTGFRDRIEVVTMDGFSGYHTATTQNLLEVMLVMDLSHVVALAREKLITCRQRLQQQIHGHRGRKEDLLYRGRCTLLTRRSLLNGPSQDRLRRLFAERDEHAALDVSYLV